MFRDAYLRALLRSAEAALAASQLMRYCVLAERQAGEGEV